MKTYVHDGMEIKLTGREAKKTVITGSTGKVVRELKLVEITPVDTTYDWKKWIPFEQLYEIVEKA